MELNSRLFVTITFNSNGGNVIDSLKIQKSPINRKVRLPIPVKEGYTFVCWCTDSALTTTVDMTCFFHVNFVLYAKWRPRRFTVNFDKQNGNNGSNKAIATFNSPMPTISFPFEIVTAPTRLGHYFQGYYAQPLGVGIQYYSATMASSHVWNIPSNAVLYAKWQAMTVFVEFDSTGGSPSSFQSNYTFGQPYLPLPIPAYDGYTFMGWWSLLIGGMKITTSTLVKNHNIHTLYARWEAKNYVVTLNQQGGLGGTTSVIGTFNQFLPSATPPSKQNFVFSGYYSKPNGLGICYYDENMATVSPWQIANDDIIYANWEKMPNQPITHDGLNPLYWDNAGNEVLKYTTLSPLVVNPNWTESNWYHYADTNNSNNQARWANAKSKDGSYWVWIPRFIYNFISGWHSGLTGEIQIKFVNGVDDNSLGIPLVNTGNASDSNETWTSHPAFFFNNQNITGFWFSKFPVFSDTHNNIQSLPGIIIQSFLSLNDFFTTALTMKNNSAYYGWDANQIDTHLMTNFEWGAVTYLAHSRFGRNGTPIGTTNFTVGGGIGAAWQQNTNLSTTNNRYGVYDMNGGYREMVSAFSIQPYYPSSPTCVHPSQNGLSAYTESGTSYCTEYDLDYNNCYYFKGDAFYETSEAVVNLISVWHNSTSTWIIPPSPWILRSNFSPPNNSMFQFFGYDGAATTFPALSSRISIIIHIPSP